MLPQKSKSEFQTMMEGATVIEAVGKKKEQVKVAQLSDGRILKLFRQRGLTITSRIRKPYCVSFKQNAEKLISLGIPSIHVEDVFYIPHLRQYGVLYPILPGTSLRVVLQEADHEERTRWIERFAEFVSSLHDKGVHFRALHMGNIIITEEEKFGLIDVADMVFHKRALKLSERCRNFEHVTRYKKDIILLTEEQDDTFINAYLQASSADQIDSNKLRVAFEHGCQNPKLK